MNTLARRRLTVAAAFAAALALALAGCASGATSAASTTPSATTTATSAPTATSTPSVTPTRTAYSPPCAASQLRLTAGQGGAALGHLVTSYSFTNISTTACSLRGYASAQIAGHAVRIQQTPSSYIWSNIPVNTTELLAGHRAYFAIQTDDVTTSGYTCFTAPATIFPPGSSMGFASQADFTICDGQLFISPLVEADSEL